MNIEDSTAWRTWLAQNPRSRAHAERASRRVPSGTSRSLLRHPPFPFYVERAAGVTSVDLDGNERIDCHNNYTTLIHGHGHPVIRAAIERQLALGTTYSAPGAQEYALAEHLCGRVNSVEQVVFNNSGTEAVMVALRIARAVTGRNRIAKFEGGYHGATDFVMVGGHGLPAPDDPVRVSEPHADVGGLPAAASTDVVLIRYNDAEAVREAVARFGDELAAIIVEPIQGAGGVIPATAEFLHVLREETRRTGIVLICDEVITLRHAVGGAQGFYGLDPDLTTMAKIIGGGFPVGAVGGRQEFMQSLDAGGAVANLGTFSANPMTMAAGLAAMELLDEAAIGHLNALGERVRDGLRAVIAALGLPAQVSGAGSLFQVHWTRQPLVDARTAERADPDLNLLTFLGLANRGVQLSMRGIGALSTPMTTAIIDTLIDAFADTARELRADGYV
ncbi:MAG: aspartate aminotransferase family protein [Gammaproteobacteria bacterium]|nr:aspartate aminotransferase family protein [Gammaproteobacteria bacterium]MCP5199084.1 aspartate aminotransferase family protein [Gammaproteobacteria bacterium]